MRQFTHISLLLAALIALMPGDALWAKGGRGGPKGGGGKGFKGSANFPGHGGGKAGAGPTHRGTGKPSFTSKRDAMKEVLDDGDQPWTKHQAREQRKLEHRQRVADHLREVSDRNGNEHLKQVADDMDARAQAHYEKQLEKIRQHKYGPDDAAPDDFAPWDAADNRPGGIGETLDDSREFLNGKNYNLDEWGRKLTGRENAAAQQMRNELRNLTRRMEAVERMRSMAEETGNENLLQAADRLEQQTLERFEQRMEKISEFRQRHGLPDIEHHVTP